MKTDTRQLLTRWQALRDEQALQKIKIVIIVLWLIAIALFISMVVCVAYNFNPILLASCAAALGWITAERNALQTRLSHWPTFRTYIDWQRVESDLSNDPNS